MLLDADILIDLWRNHPPAATWFANLPEPPPAAGLAGMELLWGCQNSSSRRAVINLLKPLPLYWPSESAMLYALRDLSKCKLSHNLGLVDSLIAATALEHDEPLATFNTRHFGSVPGLVTVQPYSR